MINTASLTGAGLATSKNPTLQQLFSEVQQYNGLPPGPGNAQAIRLLDKIMKHAAVYLTSKPPQLNKAKNKLRWDAMKDLANDAAQEAKARGVKLLSSPADFREIKGNVSLGAQSYWLERVDPLHRPGYVLSAKYENWVNTPDTFARKKSFWDAIGHEGSEDSVIMVKGDDADGVPFVECYRITFNAAGVALNALDQVFTTRDLSTVHSGAGWAVFVCSPAGELYARTHELGYFHHSSFLAGKPVAAAGELLVDEAGMIKIITAKTGHYRAGVDEMKQLLQIVPQIPGSAFILPEFIKIRLQPSNPRLTPWAIFCRHSVPEDCCPGASQGNAGINQRSWTSQLTLESPFNLSGYRMSPRPSRGAAP